MGIINVKFASLDEFEELMGTLNDGALMAQEIATQSALRAISRLLDRGVTHENAQEMLLGLKEQIAIVNSEWESRKMKPKFATNKSNFH